MKPTFVVLCLGAVAGVVTHFAWFQTRRPCAGDALECQLAWMRAELRLNDQQFNRIRAIHEASTPRLLVLAAQVARMRDEYAAFERERTTAGQIDFVEFARFVDQRRAIDRECLDSTRSLVAATCRAMDPEQRAHYIGLLHPAFQDTGAALPP